MCACKRQGNGSAETPNTKLQTPASAGMLPPSLKSYGGTSRRGEPDKAKITSTNHRSLEVGAFWARDNKMRPICVDWIDCSLPPFARRVASTDACVWPVGIHYNGARVCDPQQAGAQIRRCKIPARHTGGAAAGQRPALRQRRQDEVAKHIPAQNAGSPASIRAVYCRSFGKVHGIG